MDVQEVMVKKVVSVRADASVKEAVDLMNQHEIGCLVIEKNGQVEGIVTERDILKRVVSELKNIEQTSVSEAMSKPLIVGGPTMYIEDAARLMFRKNIKKLPVMDGDKIVGIITLSDIARAANTEPQMTKVIEELMNNGWYPTRKMQKVVDYYVV